MVKRLDNKVIDAMTREEFELEPRLIKRAPDFSKYNLLLVDDDPGIISSVSSYLALVENLSVLATVSPYIARELIDSYKKDEVTATPEMIGARALVAMETAKTSKKLDERDFQSYTRADLQLPNGKELAQIYDEGLVLIISDAKMGGINGFQLLNYASEKIPNTFRLILSAEIGYAQQKNPEELFSAGAVGYINKGMPDYETALVNKIKNVFGQEVLARNLHSFADFYRKHVNKIN